MQEIDNTGSFYLGKTEDKPLLYDSKNFTTHAVCVGMTGSGKTGLGIALLEEAGLRGTPALIIDPKGDLGNLMLTFPQLLPSEFLPWIDAAEASRNNQTPEQYAETISKTWKEGLAKWGEDADRIARLKQSVDMVIYTPASEAGISLSILNSFSAPSDEILLDSGALRDRILSVTSSLLGLLGIEADPIKSREHILLSTLFDKSWREKKDLTLPALIQQIQKPPFDKIGVLDLETFFPQKERRELSVSLNNLLASPGFQAWMQGEPLDIQNLLYTKEGKPRLAIITIAHLSDAERMFFVTILLNELIGWMRRQSGTSHLRALLYMDEIFGYFPPVAMPPSKRPMLTLLKQARAFGLGIVLATQNPVDLDYKGLSNCGTWFIGKLQTERDKARVLEGLNVASNGELDTASLNKMITSCGNRVFILRSVHLKEPILFQTRWTMSYLRGPLTLLQIQSLMSNRKEKQISVAPVKEKPSTPMGVQEYFLSPKKTADVVKYTPKVLGIGKMHFVDAKNKVDTWQQYAVVASAFEDSSTISWEQGEEITTAMDRLDKDAVSPAHFEELPAILMQSKNYSAFSKSFADYLYQNKTFDLFEALDAKMFSKPGESETDFRSRASAELREKAEEEIRKVRDHYDSRMQTLQEKIQRLQGKAEAQKTQVGQRKFDAFISAVAAILGAFIGRGVSKGSITQAGTSIRKASKIGQEQENVARTEETLGSLQQQLTDLQIEMDKEISHILSDLDPEHVKIEKTKIRPRKSDISVEIIALVWCPV